MQQLTWKTCRGRGKPREDAGLRGAIYTPAQVTDFGYGDRLEIEKGRSTATVVVQQVQQEPSGKARQGKPIRTR